MDAARLLGSLGVIERIEVTAARRTWREFRTLNGWAPHAPILTPPGANMKMAKSTKAGVVTYGLSLAPSDISGFNVCRFSTPACRSGCVAFAGSGRYKTVIEARKLKTRFLMEHPRAFVTLLDHEIGNVAQKFDNVAVRLNTFSDLPWEKMVPWLFEEHPTIQWYDYTKNPNRTGVPSNYRLTLSSSEKTKDSWIAEKVKAGNNVAVVFSASRHKELPEVWNGLPVIDGDISDTRHLDPRGVVVGLRAKGSMRKNPMGMVREVVE